MFGDGCDGFFEFCSWVDRPADWGWRIEELTAQVVQ
jgi:hypothetical protein